MFSPKRYDGAPVPRSHIANSRPTHDGVDVLELGFIRCRDVDEILQHPTFVSVITDAFEIKTTSFMHQARIERRISASKFCIPQTMCGKFKVENSPPAIVNVVERTPTTFAW